MYKNIVCMIELQSIHFSIGHIYKTPASSFLPILLIRWNGFYIGQILIIHYIAKSVCSPAFQVHWRPVLHHCIWHLALLLLMYCVDAAARPWKPIPWSSLSTGLELTWRPHEVWRSVAHYSAESCRPLCTMCLSIGWPCTIILRGLPLHGRIAVVPNRYH